MNYVIFTDLDGTLLDSETYEFKGAKNALSLIREKEYPLIIVTSKTRWEVVPLLKKLNIEYPFVVENGGGTFFFKSNSNVFNENLEYVDDFYVRIFGKTYDEIREIFEKIKEIAPVKGFGDMDDATISKMTKLPIEQVKFAKKREFSEPFILEGDVNLYLNKIFSFARENDLKILRGGRFYHLMDINQDKGKAVKYLIGLYKNFYGDVISVGLGDSENDVDFLEVVDIPVIIRKKDGSFVNVNLKNKMVSRLPETLGWNEALLEVLK